MKQNRAAKRYEGSEATENGRVLTFEALIWGMRPHNRQTVIERFWARVAIGEQDECWFWRGATTAARYGILSVNREMIRAHRLAYLLENGALPHDRYVLHKCNEPSCVNPRHLVAGTAAQNSADMIASGRGSNRKLCDDDVRTIRADHAAGVSLRALALRYSVAPGTIWHVTSRKTWRKVLDRVNKAA